MTHVGLWFIRKNTRPHLLWGAVRLRIKDYVAHNGPKLTRMSKFHR